MRIFIAIDLPTEVKNAISKEAAGFTQKGIVTVKGEAYHISLLFLGELSESQLEKAKEALNSIKQKEFEVGIKGLDFFTPEFLKVIFAKVGKGKEECANINHELVEKLTKEGFSIKQEPYSPHITIARVKNDKAKHEIISKVSKSANIPFGLFTVNSIKLKSSQLKPEGPVYTDLYELKL